MKLIAISYGKKIAKFIATGYLITIKIALVVRIQVLEFTNYFIFRKSRSAFMKMKLH